MIFLTVSSNTSYAFTQRDFIVQSCVLRVGVTHYLLLQNIELKVEVESLKQELQEKQQLLDKAL